MGFRRDFPVYYTDHIPLPLPEGHRFPERKYQLLRELLIHENLVPSHRMVPAEMAPPELLHLAHSPSYVQSIMDGSVDPGILKRIGFPWSPDLHRRTSASVGGALAAARSALEFGVSSCLAGGTHHAHYDRGEGYCVYNDIAVVTRYLQREGWARRVFIFDLDVHQGNGNSSILGKDEGVFIASIHGEKNYPFIKVPGTLDIGLPEGTGDEQYLEALDEVIECAERFQPDYVFYQMGVDALEFDKLGKLKLTYEGLMERDRRVLGFSHENHIPVSLALGGGYSDPIEQTVRAYANTYKVLKEFM